MKRFFSIATVLLMIFSLSVSAAANTWVLPEGQHSYMMQVPPSGQDDPPIFIYTLNEKDEAEIIDFFGEAYDLKIPRTFGKYPVVSIADDAFTMSKTLLSVIIPDSITKIGDYAFSRCTELKSVTIPESVTEIGEYAFSGCIALKSVEIPSSITVIKEGTFASCLKLAVVILPESLQSIGEDAFLMCRALESVEIPENTKVAETAFRLSGMSD